MKRRNVLAVVLLSLLATPPSWADSSDLRDPVLPDVTSIQKHKKPAEPGRHKRVALSDDGSARLLKAFNALTIAPQGPSAVVDTLAIRHELLRAPPEIGLNRKFAAFEPIVEAGIQTLTIEGQTYELAFISQAIDEKFGVRHVTMQVLDVPESYARFSISWDGYVLGTLQTQQAVYRIVPLDADTQLVYRMKSADGRPLRHRRVADASTSETVRRLERRHAQLEQLADIRPDVALTSEQGGTLNLQGGRLGKMTLGEITPDGIAQVLWRFSDLAFVSGLIEVRIKNIFVRSTDRQIGTCQ